MQSEVSHARHNLRGRLNALKLCVSALCVSSSDAEALEFLRHIIESTEKVQSALDAFDLAAENEINYAADLRSTGSG